MRVLEEERSVVFVSFVFGCCCCFVVAVVFVVVFKVWNA